MSKVARNSVRKYRFFLPILGSHTELIWPPKHWVFSKYFSTSQNLWIFKNYKYFPKTRKFSAKFIKKIKELHCQTWNLLAFAPDSEFSTVFLPKSQVDSNFFWPCFFKGSIKAQEFWPILGDHGEPEVATESANKFLLQNVTATSHHPLPYFLPSLCSKVYHLC